MAYLLPVNDVEKPGLAIHVRNIPRMEIPFTIPIPRVRIRVLKVPIDDRRTPNTQLTSRIRLRNVLPIITDQLQI